MKIYNSILGPVSTNCYYLVNEQTCECIIVDPAAEFEVIKKRIDELNVKPVAVLLTHGHFDHIMACDRVRNEYGIKVYASEAEQDLMGDTTLNLSSAFGFSYRTSADILLKDEEAITLAGMSIKCIHTPGHTVGGMCYFFEESGCLISGDTLFNGSVGRTDFPTGSARILTESIKAKLFKLPLETICYPGHGEPTSIEYEMKYNPCL